MCPQGGDERLHLGRRLGHDVEGVTGAHGGVRLRLASRIQPRSSFTVATGGTCDGFGEASVLDMSKSSPCINRMVRAIRP